MTGSGGFLNELRRRKVVRVAVVYAASAFAVLQTADIILPRLGVPEWVMSLVVVLSIAGFALAVVLGWVLEFTPEGIRTTSPRAESSSEGADVGGADPEIPSLFGRRTLVTAALLVVLGVGIGVGMGGGLLIRANAGDAGVPSGADGAALSAADELAVPADDRSIAVLAFANRSTDPADEYFADGLSEEILNVLSQVVDLRVAGRTSSFAWKGGDEEERSRMERVGVRNVDAFVTYQRGVELYDRAHGTLSLLPTLREANALFAEATRIVPEFSAAHFRMVDYYSHVLLEAPDGHDLEAAVTQIRELVAVATETATDPNFRAHREVDRVIFSSDWTALGKRVEDALAEEGCPSPTYMEPLAIVGFASP